MDCNRRNVTRDFIFYLRLCKDPMLVFPMSSIFCNKANDWLYHLVDYDCHSLDEKRLRNQYLARLVACLDVKVLVPPFLDAAGGPLIELPRHYLRTDENEERIFCDRHRSYLLTCAKRKELDEALQHLEVKRHISQTALAITDNKPAVSCDHSNGAIKDETINHLRNIELTLSDLQMQTKRLTNSIHPELSSLDTARQTGGLQRSHSDLSKSSVRVYKTLCAQTDEMLCSPFECNADAKPRNVGTQRNLSPFTQDYINNFVKEASMEIKQQQKQIDHKKYKHQQESAIAVKRSHKTGSEEKRRKSSEQENFIGAKGDLQLQAPHQHRQRETHTESKRSDHKHKTEKAHAHHKRTDKSPRKEHHTQEKREPSPKAKKPWFLDSSRTTQCGEQQCKSKKGHCSRTINCHRCQGSVSIPRDYNLRPAVSETLQAAKKTDSAGHGYGDAGQTVPSFGRSISELSLVSGDCIDNNLSSVDFDEFNQEMEEFQRQNFSGEPTINFARESQETVKIAVEKVEDTGFENQLMNQILGNLTLVCKECIIERDLVEAVRTAELSPLPNLEAILQNCHLNVNTVKFMCNKCQKKKLLHGLFFKKNEEQTGKISKFTLKALPPRHHPNTDSKTGPSKPHKQQESEKTKEGQQQYCRPNFEMEDLSTEPPLSATTAATTAGISDIANSICCTDGGTSNMEEENVILIPHQHQQQQQQQPQEDGLAASKEDNGSFQASAGFACTPSEQKRIHVLLHLIAKERSGAAKPYTNDFLEHNIKRFAKFISQFENKYKEIQNTLSAAEVRQNLLDMMVMDLESVLSSNTEQQQ